MSYILACLLLASLSLALDAKRPVGLIVPRPNWREPLPARLSFESSAGFEVQDAEEFARLFPSARTCSTEIAPMDLRVRSAGENTLDVSINGLSSWRLASGIARYVPVHYRFDQVIHPYFVVRAADGTQFHIEIRTLTTGRRLTVSLVRGEPGAEFLDPVFTTR